MQERIKMADVELSEPAEGIDHLHDYPLVKAMVRLHGVPLGYVDVPVCNGRCSGRALRQAALAQYGPRVVEEWIRSELSAGRPEGLNLETHEGAGPEEIENRPPVTVAICTRNRVLDLARCLDSLAALRYRPVEVLVVDNAPANDSTERLVRGSYPQIRYVCEPRPGLNWARNRAIMEATGEIIAFTDDDVVVDANWLSAIVAVFAANKEVMAVTGLVAPLELETKSQIFFETYGGGGRGFRRRWVHRSNEWGADMHSAWRFGSGANMAYRRTLFERVGYFDAALDLGTVANGGGDLEMFFRLLMQGHTLVYEPSAIVRHRHRRTYEQLRAQAAGIGVGHFSYLVRSAMAYPSEWWRFLRAGWRRMWGGNLLRLLHAFLHPSQVPKDLILVELIGCFVGLGRYYKSRSAAVQIAHRMGSLNPVLEQHGGAAAPLSVRGAVAVRTIDLTDPVQPITDVEAYDEVRLHVTRAGRYVGEVTIPNVGAALSRMRISDALVNHLGLRLLHTPAGECDETIRACALAAVQKRFCGEAGSPAESETRLPEQIAASVVVVANENADALRACLRSVACQRTGRAVEIIVVDTCPDRSCAAAVVAEFTNARVVNESRCGSAYARNAGLIASSGEIVVLTEASMRMPENWLEQLLAPFVHPEVMVVTGNVLASRLESAAARLFDWYAGPGRGPDPIQADHTWFKRFRYSGVPAGLLGTAANMALRATVLTHAQIGLLEETLGTTRGDGAEESYLFYRVLQAGYKIAYEPSACVWHEPPADMGALRTRVFRWAQGSSAYHLLALMDDGDLGALLELVLHWPRRWGARFARKLFGKSGPPLGLMLVELVGWLSGPWRLLSSSRAVRKQGRSGFYVPVGQRSEELWNMVRSPNIA